MSQNSAQKMILPPACIGILGGGQLGMMLAKVAQQFGYQVAILEPDPNCPARKYADWHLVSSYDDPNALSELARRAAVITTEFENVPAASIEQLAKVTPVYPTAAAILIAQNRLKEKNFFHACGLATAPFVAINSAADCYEVSPHLLPGILKTTTLGYDGKGQIRVKTHAELAQAFTELGSGECILERLVELRQEVSVIVARNQNGSNAYPVIENRHQNGILDVSLIPAQIQATLENQAEYAALTLVEALDYIGILTIEFFITAEGQLLVNEIAPRPHNSGHITIEAAHTSQFEQQLRAVCGLPLAPSGLKQPGAMLNLLGDLWLQHQEQLNHILLAEFPYAKLHCYGKSSAKPGRKMGHLSLTASTRAELESQLKQLKARLQPAP